MPLHRIEPVVRNYDLGCLRLWQDDLVEIVRIIKQLPGAVVRVEADNNWLDDVAADLPELGQRVGYFRVTANMERDAPPGIEILRVEFNRRQRGRITATEPDLMAIGVIEALRTFIKGHRWRFGYLSESFGPATLMITGTHDAAPTFWQRHRAEIAINIVVAIASGAVFFFLGIWAAGNGY